MRQVRIFTFWFGLLVNIVASAGFCSTVFARAGTGSEDLVIDKQLNIIKNSGFEQGSASADGWMVPPPSNFSIDASVQHSGAKSARVVIKDPGSQILLFQTFPVHAGEQYTIGAWIRTENVKGPGAQVFIEWQGPNGQWLGGQWDARLITGTQAWQYVSVPKIPVPQGAATAIFYVGLLERSTGTAWFDDVSVEKNVPPLLETFLLFPNYARQILPGIPSPEVRIDVAVSPESRGLRLKDMEVVAEIARKAGGKPLATSKIKPLLKRNFEMSLDLPDDLPRGVYDISVRVSSAGKPLARRLYEVKKLSIEDKASLSSYVDLHNRLILNGEPFFPLGLYVVQGLDETAELDDIAQSPFDTVVNYNINSGTKGQVLKYLDELSKRKLKLLFAMNDYIGKGQEDIDIIAKNVEAFRSHPAVLGWYMNDEIGMAYLPQLEARYKTIRDLDASHPVWSVSMLKHVMVGEAHTTDVLGADPYPIPNASITAVADTVDWAKDVAKGYRPIWPVLQIFSWQDYGRGGRPPTMEEMRAMTYLAINHGAKGLFYYSYFDIRNDADFSARWPLIKKVAEEVVYLRSTLLSIDSAADVSIVCDNKAIDFRLMRNGDSYVLTAVNTSKDSLPQVSFQNGSKHWPTKVSVLFESGRQVAVAAGEQRITDEFGPYGVHVYTWTKSIHRLF